MQVTSAARAIIAVLIVALPYLNDFRQATSETPRQLEEWLNDNYPAVVNRLLPAGNIFDSGFPKETQWTVTVRILPGFEAPESRLTLSKRYDGLVVAGLIVPDGDSIIKQMRALRQAHPDLNAETMAEEIKLNNVVVASKQYPELQKLATQLDAARFTLTLPDELITDPTVYEFWTRSQWGAEMHVKMDGSSFQPQHHPLLAWAQEFHSTALRYVARGTATTSQ
jgi:hypothetical protein